MMHKPYCEALGSCMWVQVATHPDIPFAVSVLSHFQSNPGPAHWTAMLHLLAYLKGSINYKISYSWGGDLAPIGFVDADYAGDIDTCCSTSGYVFTIAGGPVSWKGHAHAKHIDIRHHYIRKHISNGEIKVVQVPSEDNLVDLLTKPLNCVTHQKLVRALKMDL